MRDDYKKFNGFLVLIRKLCEPVLRSQWLTYQDIQDILNCNRRTAERVVKKLSNTYPEFKIERDLENYKIKRFHMKMPKWLMLKPIEDFDIIALSAAKKHIKNQTLTNALRDLEEKLLYKQNKTKIGNTAPESDDLESKMVFIDTIAGPEAEIKVEKKITETLLKAIVNCNHIEIEYANFPKPFTVCPLGILCGNTNNYLVAAANMYIEHYKPKTYVIDKIKNIKIKQEKFKRKNFDLHKFSEKSFGVFHSEHGPYNVKWLVLPESADEAKRYYFHKTQKIKPNSDGSLTITMRSDGLREMAMFLFRWSGTIIPIAPTELVVEYKRLINAAQESLNKYLKEKQ